MGRTPQSRQSKRKGSKIDLSSGYSSTCVPLGVEAQALSAFFVSDIRHSGFLPSLELADLGRIARQREDTRIMHEKMFADTYAPLCLWLLLFAEPTGASSLFSFFFFC